MAASENAHRELDLYVRQISKVPLLSPAEESRLAFLYRRERDPSVEQQLVLANLRFVVKIARQYGGYRLPLLDLVQEGNLGLVTAVRKFEPERGHRLISYAHWWIRAHMQSYIMRNWSLVKIGTTQAQRRLFFRLRSTRQQLEQQQLNGEAASDAALGLQLCVATQEISNMETRLRDRDHSLDLPVVDACQGASVDVLQSAAPSQEEGIIGKQLRQRLRRAIDASMAMLSPKERYVIQHRLLHAEPPTLLQIGKVLRISRERVRQIEGEVIRKLRQLMMPRAVA